MFDLIYRTMKSMKYLISVALIGALFTYSACSKSSPPAPSVKDQQLAKLSQTWKCTNATLQNTPQSGYNNFTLTISGTPGQDTFGYTTAGRPTGLKSSPWASSGTFTFGTDPSTQMNRDVPTENLPVTYSVTSTTLQLTFTYNGPGFDARVGNVTGVWVYTFGL
jgi:hypothetical protein